MEFSRLLASLSSDFTRLAEAAEDNLDARVPGCPEWTVEDLVRHVAVVYLHKTECMRLGVAPQPWPPDLGDEPPLHLLHRAYAALTGEFAAREPASPAATWYEPDQTVGFWIRRMAHETVIHRIDAECSGRLAGTAPGPVPQDIALDGIDEVLDRFLRYGTHRWAEEFASSLPPNATPPVRVSADGASWLVRAQPDGADVQRVPAEEVPGSQAPAQVSGDPESVLLWLWRRVGDERVSREGDQALIDGLRDLLHDATQ